MPQLRSDFNQTVILNELNADVIDNSSFFSKENILAAPKNFFAKKVYKRKKNYDISNKIMETDFIEAVDKYHIINPNASNLVVQDYCLEKINSIYGIKNSSMLEDSVCSNKRVDLITTASKVHDFLNIIRDIGYDEKREKANFINTLKYNEKKNNKTRNKKLIELTQFFTIKKEKEIELKKQRAAGMGKRPKLINKK